MKTKKIVVIYSGDDWHKEIPFSSPATKISFENWHERGLQENVEFYRASIKWFNKKNLTFSKSWAYRDKVWIKVTVPVKPDLIFDKVAGKHDYALFDWKMRLAQNIPIFNHPLFRTIADNKLSQYLILGEFMPQSFLATNITELQVAAKKIKSSKVVLKPIYGSGGIGIVIDEKKKALQTKLTYPVFAQEFIVSQKGIPGFSQKNEVSDLRLIFMNHKLVYALSRIAKKGSLFTNFHQGASAVLVPKKYIPKNVQTMTKKIIQKLSVFPSANYSLDFIFTNSGKPLLVEMNTTPGFDLLHIVGDEKTKNKNFQEFISILK